MTATTTITRQLELDLDVERLWELVGDAAGLSRWLGERVDVDVVPGGRGVATDRGIERAIVVREVEHGRRLSFVWAPADDVASASHVRLELEALEGGRSCLRIEEVLLAPSAGDAEQAQVDWEVRVCSLWAVCVAAALATAAG